MMTWIMCINVQLSYSDVEYDIFVSFHLYLFLGLTIFLEIYALLVNS